MDNFEKNDGFLRLKENEKEAIYGRYLNLYNTFGQMLNILIFE